MSYLIIPVLFLFAVQGYTVGGGRTAEVAAKPICKKEESKNCHGCTDGTQVIQCKSGHVFASCTSGSTTCTGSGHKCQQDSGGNPCKPTGSGD